MYKHFLLTAFVTFFMIFFVCTAVNAADDIKLVIDGKRVECDVPPLIQNGRTLVPVRVVLEHFGADVQWNEAFRQVVINQKGKILILTIDSYVTNFNGEAQMIDAAPIIVEGRTLVPVRYIASSFGYEVGWNEATRTVSVNSKKAELPETDTSDKAEKEEPKAYINSVKVSESKDSYTINVALTSEIKPKIMTLSDPYRIVFDFYDTALKGKDGNVKSTGDMVTETRWAGHEDYIRVVIQCNYKCEYSYSYTTSGICKIIVKADKKEQTTQNTTTQKPTTQKPTTQKPVQNIIPAGSTPVVVIDAGHGGRDPGAVGRDEDDNIVLQEKDVCLNIALKVQKLLKAEGVSVIMTRSTDIALGDTQQDDLAKRAEIANESTACLFVSIHNNAFTNDTANGTCVLYAGLESVGDYGISGKELAQNLQDELIDAIGLFDRGIVESPGIAVLRKTVMPAALVECAFITNPDDRQVLATKQNEMAEAISKAIVKSLVEMGRLK